MNDRFLAPIFTVVRDWCTASAEEKAQQGLDDKFEKLVWSAFRALGYDVVELGHRQPFRRVPDGLAFSRPPLKSHGFILDAKLYQPYSIRTDDRTYIEYIHEFAPDFSRRGVDGFSLVIIACSFAGEWDQNILRIRDAAHAAGFSNVILLETEALLYLVQGRTRCAAIGDDFFDKFHRNHQAVVDVDTVRHFTTEWLATHAIGEIISSE